MPISGWVATLAADESQRAEVIQHLRADTRVTVGEQMGARLPFVLDTSCVNEERTLIETLSDHPTVLFIDLVFVDFSDVDSLDSDHSDADTWDADRLGAKGLDLGRSDFEMPRRGGRFESGSVDSLEV